MQIQVSTDANIECHEALTTQTSSVVESALSRFSDHITRVEVHRKLEGLSDPYRAVKSRPSPFPTAEIQRIPSRAKAHVKNPVAARTGLNRESARKIPTPRRASQPRVHILPGWNKVDLLPVEM